MQIAKTAASRLAEAADARTGGSHTWTVTRNESDFTISIEQGGRERVLGYVAPSGNLVAVRTANRTHRIGARADLTPIIDELVAGCESLTRLDLVTGTRYRVQRAVRDLRPGSIVELVAIDEHKPSGRDLYQFRDGTRLIEWCEDDPAIVRLLDDFGSYFAFAPTTEEPR